MINRKYLLINSKKVRLIILYLFVSIFSMTLFAQRASAQVDNSCGALTLDFVDTNGESIREKLGVTEVPYNNLNPLVSTVTKVPGTNLTHKYSYKITAASTSANKSYLKAGGELLSGDNEKRDTFNVSSLGGFNLILAYQDTTGKQPNGDPCAWTDGSDGNTINFIFSNSAISSPNVVINSYDEAVNQGDPLKVNFTIKGYTADESLLYQISINTGEGRCTADSDTIVGCWSTKKEEALPAPINGEHTFDFQWDTTANTTVGTHKIKIKVYSVAFSGEDVPDVSVLYGKSVYVEICDKNAAPGTCTPSLIPESEDDTTNIKINNPKTNKVTASVKSFGGLINKIFIVLQIIIGALSFIGLMIGGVLYITSNGDTSKVDKAKKTLIYSILGLLLAVLSYAIFRVIANTIKI